MAYHVHTILDTRHIIIITTPWGENVNDIVNIDQQPIELFKRESDGKLHFSIFDKQTYGNSILFTLKSYSNVGNRSITRGKTNSYRRVSVNDICFSVVIVSRFDSVIDSSKRLFNLLRKFFCFKHGLSIILLSPKTFAEIWAFDALVLTVKNWNFTCCW